MEVLTNLINGNDLPDLVSVTAGMDDLVNSGKIFPINGLAERWAPSLWRRVEEEGEMYASYQDSEGDLYYLVNNFYNSGEMEEYRKLGGNILPNDGIVVRKDYLEAFCNYKKSQDASWTDAEMANPDGVFEFVDAVVGGAIPRQYIPAVEKGLREAAPKGILADYPVINLKCTVFDGKSHPVDSKEIAFITAAKLAFQDGCSRANPVFLEPIMHIDITVPDSYMGDIMGDLSKRRGRILGTDSVNGKTVVSAEAPQAELAKYATDLRSMTQGRGKFSTAFERYEEVPASQAAKIIEDYKKRMAANN